MSKMNISPGKKAVLQRARQLTEFVWTPLRDVPVFTLDNGKTILRAMRRIKGMLYSSTEPVDKFITENVSFETFRTIVNNPDSALYNKDLGGHNNSWAYFGVVCNGLARYALNIPRRYSTKRWPDIPGMRKIADDGKYTVNEIEICDVLYAYGKGRNHVALVTDLIYDEAGRVTHVEVSEAIRPYCIRRIYSAEDFYEEFKLFGLCRYDYIDDVPLPDSSYTEFFAENSVSLTPHIAVDYGNKTNYRTYEDVVVSVFDDGENEIEVIKDNNLSEKIVINGRGSVSRCFEKGYYKLIHSNSGEYVEFGVTEPLINHSVKDGFLTVNVSSGDANSFISHMEFREKTRDDAVKDAENTFAQFYNSDCAPLSKMEELTEEEKKTGIITRKIPDDANNFKVYFKNQYGIWTHKMIRI